MRLLHVQADLQRGRRIGPYELNLFGLGKLDLLLLSRSTERRLWLAKRAAHVADWEREFVAIANAAGDNASTVSQSIGVK